MEIRNIPIGKIKPDKNQPRQTLDHERIRDMSLSIKTEGVINPIEVDEKFVIITGEMRWRAASLAELTEMPCRIVSIKPYERFRRQVAENIHHNTMTDWDTAKALEKLINLRPGRTFVGGKGNKEGASQLARELGKSRDYIAEHLHLLEVSPKIQKALAQQKIPYTLVRAVQRAPQELQKQMEHKVLKGEFATRDAAIYVAHALEKNPDRVEDILEEDYSQYKTYPETVKAVNKIVPPTSEKVGDSFSPVNELNEIIQKLRQWMVDNPGHKVGYLHLPRIVMTLTVLGESIVKWLNNNQAAKKQLKGDTNE